MEEGETVSIPTRKELRKQKLMEYLATKGRLKLPNPKPYLRDDDCHVKKPVTAELKIVKGKENKAPADTFRSGGSKVKTSAAQSTKHPPKRALSVSGKVNVKENTLTGRQKDKHPLTVCDPATLELNQNPVLTQRGNIVSSKSSGSTITHQNIQPSAKANMQSFSQASSKTASIGKFNSGSRYALLGPAKLVSTRMSLGPVVKTKTGLIPAVTQPRNSQQHFVHIIPTAAHTSTNSIKVRPSTASTISVSQKPDMVHRKTFPNTALINRINERTVSLTAQAGIRVQNQNTSNSKPLPGKHPQPSCQVSSRGLKSVSTSKCTAAPVKLERRGGMSKTNKSTVEPTDRVTKQKSEGGGEKHVKPSKVPSQTPLETTRRPISKVVRQKVTQAAVADLRGKTKTCKETQSKKGQTSTNVPLPLTAMKRSGAPVISQTVPQPARTISLTGRATNSKTPKVSVRAIPQTEVKKMTADQEERMRKLQEWREARGISYKRPPMPVKPTTRRTVAVHQPFWTTMKEEDEAHTLICAVDRSLADCIKLLGEGCPPDQVKEVLSRLPAVSQKFAKYWICQARLMELEGNLDVLPVFEEAVRVVLEPVDELRTVVFEILKKKDEIQGVQSNEKNENQILTDESSPESINNPMMTPTPVRALICGEKGDSSVVKYKITATPGGPPSQRREPSRVNGQEVRFFTPVRRSVRIERASLRYPASLQEHDVCVTSYNDLMSKEDEEKCKEQEDGETSPSTNDTPMYIYRQNEALKDKVFVQLFSD